MSPGERIALADPYSVATGAPAPIEENCEVIQDIQIEATERSPEVVFRFSANRFSIRGESYPEDVASFYRPLVQILEKHLLDQRAAEIEVVLEFIYFNSSTAKMLMILFDLFDAAAAVGNDVTIHWVCEEDDENMEEMGDDFAEDLEHAHFMKRVVEG